MTSKLSADELAQITEQIGNGDYQERIEHGDFVLHYIYDRDKNEPQKLILRETIQVPKSIQARAA
jgi:hypothetical protein